MSNFTRGSPRNNVRTDLFMANGSIIAKENVKGGVAGDEGAFGGTTSSGFCILGISITH